MSTETAQAIASPDIARLSDRARHAIKVALAMVIAYGLSLQWGWLNPSWAGIAIAFCSLTTRGESLNKSVLRLWGTLFGVFAAFFFLALFSQDRWWFVSAVSLYCAVVTYLMIGSKAQYFWQVAGFVCLIITLTGPTDPANVFEHGLARGYETALGCTVWALVNLLFWPATNRKALVDTARQLVATQHEAYGVCRDLTLGRVNPSQFLELRQQFMQRLTQLQTHLRAAGAESPEVRTARVLWVRLEAESKGLLGDLDRWFLSCGDLRDIDVRTIVPGIEQFLAGPDKASAADADGLQTDAPGLTRLSNFDRAAVTTVVRRIETVSARRRSLVEISRALTAAEGVSAGLSAPLTRAVWQFPVPDPDRLRAAAFILANVWVGFLLWIFYDPPGHAAVYMMAPTLGFVAALSPHLMVARGLLRPFILYLPVGAALYLLVMPQLSGYAQLAVMIFAYVFWVQYSITNPLANVAAIMGFVMLVSISNEQTYSFVGVASNYLYMLIAVLIVVVCSYLLLSPRPEKMVVRLVRRYLRSAAFVVSRVATPDGAAESAVGRYLERFHIQQLETLPGKVAAWSGQIDRAAFAGNDTAQVDQLVTNLEGFTYRLQNLIDARSEAGAAGMTDVFGKDTAAWREEVAAVLDVLSMRLNAGSFSDLEGRLQAGLTMLDSNFSEDIAQRSDAAVAETAYHLLSACRGVSTGLAAYVRVAESVDWACWQEERF
jgi:uncharacterized membrane protein YccC